jgi:hypothetical protein
VTEEHREHIVKEIRAVMSIAEPDETKGQEIPPGISISINAPCTNRIAGGDYIEVNIHLGGDRDREELHHAADPGGDESEPATHTRLSDTLELIVPQAVRIARQFRRPHTATA